MFNLLEDLHELPLDVSEIVAVSQGMNKVRVSVGQHVSEPSEVYIVTGRKGNRLETYVVFYMIQPEVLVVYGHKDNPYEESQNEDVVTMAMDMVETMGSILQDVAWDGMSVHDREDWLAGQKLLPLVEGEWEEVGQEEALEAVEAGKTPEPETKDEPIGGGSAPAQKAGESARDMALAAAPAEEAQVDSNDPLGNAFLKPGLRVSGRRRIAPEPARAQSETIAASDETTPVVRPERERKEPKVPDIAAAPEPVTLRPVSPPSEPEAPAEPAAVSPQVPQVAAIDVGPAAFSEPAAPPTGAASVERGQADRMAVLRFLSRI